MGGFVKDILVPGILADLNLRFGPEDPIKEIAALQRTFAVFSPSHSLKDSFSLLNIGPAENWPQRKGWYKYLDSLRELPSGERGENAHDRLVAVLGSHLGSRDPRPVYFTVHSSEEDPGLRVTEANTPLAYSTEEFLTISFPTTAVEKNRAKRRAG